jgi:hypothetical protein
MMTESIPLPLLTTELAQRLIAAERDCMIDWLRAMEALGGCQTALLYRRIRDAALAGCDLLVSQCNPGTDSQRNQLRTGFRIAGSKSWWLPLPIEGDAAAG